jgi:hypothetical protein
MRDEGPPKHPSPKEDLDELFGYPKHHETLDDLSEKIDRLELEILSIRDQIMGVLGAISLSIILVVYKLFNP